MSVFESLNKSSENASEIGKKYVDTSIKYFKLKSFQLTALSISMITNILIIGSILFLALIFLGISLAFFLGDYFQNVALGYLIVGLLFILVVVIISLFRNKIDAKIIKALSSKFYNEKSNTL